MRENRGGEIPLRGVDCRAGHPQRVRIHVDCAAAAVRVFRVDRALSVDRAAIGNQPDLTITRGGARGTQRAMTPCQCVDVSVRCLQIDLCCADYVPALSTCPRLPVCTNTCCPDDESCNRIWLPAANSAVPFGRADGALVRDVLLREIRNTSPPVELIAAEIDYAAVAGAAECQRSAVHERAVVYVERRGDEAAACGNDASGPHQHALWIDQVYAAGPAQRPADRREVAPVTRLSVAPEPLLIVT